MNIGEASAVNTLLDFVFGTRGPYTDESDAELDGQAKDAAMLLAAKADKALMTGVTPADVARLWPPGPRPPRKKRRL